MLITEELISQPSIKRKPLSKRTQIRALVIIALVLAGLIGAWRLVSRKWGKGEENSDAKRAAGTFRPTDQQWESLKTAPIRVLVFRDEHTTDGKITYDDDKTTPVFSPYSGRVTKVYVRPGDRVKAGDPLLGIEASEFNQGQNDLVTSVASLKSASAQFALAEANEKRQQQLYEIKGGSLKDWLQSKADLATAEGSLRSAEIALAAVRNRLRILGMKDDEISALETSPDHQRLESQTILRAPIGGIITQRQVGLGQYINSTTTGASTPVLAIGDLSTVWVVANVRESDAPYIHVGDTVSVHAISLPDRSFVAKLAAVGTALDSTTHRLPVRAVLSNPEGVLKPEMFADFTIVTGGETTRPAVPEEALIYEGQETRVWAVTEPKTVGLRQIQIGRRKDGMVEVLSGLSPGDQVVTSGSLFIDRAAKTD